MSPKARIVANAVEPLDEQSRRLVPRASPALLEGPTGRDRDQDLPSTEPDGASNESLARIRDSVVSGLRLLEDQREKTPRAVRVPAPVDSILAEERPTQPARASTPPSDVFAPLGARDRVIDVEAATPRDRPVRNIHEKPTELDARRAPTATMQERPYELRHSEPTEPLARPRYERESEHERVLVESIYDSERGFEALKHRNPQRADDVVSLCGHLKATGDLTDRDLVLAAHMREKLALNKTPRELRDGHADRIMALGLVGRELDDRYRDQMKAQKEKLLEEFEALPDEKRGEVFADFESFAERDAANDSNFCRREMHRALREEREELHSAYVFALALDKKQQARVDANVPTVVADEDSSGGKKRRG